MKRSKNHNLQNQFSILSKLYFIQIQIIFVFFVLIQKKKKAKKRKNIFCFDFVFSSEKQFKEKSKRNYIIIGKRFGFVIIKSFQIDFHLSRQKFFFFFFLFLSIEFFVFLICSKIEKQIPNFSFYYPSLDFDCVAFLAFLLPPPPISKLFDYSKRLKTC